MRNRSLALCMWLLMLASGLGASDLPFSVEDTPLWSLLEQQEQGLREVGSPDSQRLLTEYTRLKVMLPQLKEDAHRYLGKAACSLFDSVMQTTYQSEPTAIFSFKHLWTDLYYLWRALRQVPRVNVRTALVIANMRYFIIVLSLVLSSPSYMVTISETSTKETISEEDLDRFRSKMTEIISRLPIRVSYLEKVEEKMNSQGLDFGMVIFTILFVVYGIHWISEYSVQCSAKRRRY